MTVKISLSQLDTGISDESVLGIESDSDGKPFHYWSENKHVLVPKVKTIMKNQMQVIRLLPTAGKDLLVILEPGNGTLISVFINYGTPPSPEMLVYEFDIVLPITDFEDHSTPIISSAHCLLDDGCATMDPGTYEGNPYGIFLERHELDVCQKKTNTDTCILYIGLYLSDIRLPEKSQMDVNLTVLSLDCKIELKKLLWDGSICAVDKFKSSPSKTGCQCEETPPKFKIATDIVVPISTIDFDSIFISSCDDCAGPIFTYIVFTITIWLAALRWTQRIDVDELQTLKLRVTIF